MVYPFALFQVVKPKQTMHYDCVVRPVPVIVFHVNIVPRDNAFIRYNLNKLFRYLMLTLCGLPAVSMTAYKVGRSGLRVGFANGRIVTVTNASTAVFIRYY